MGARPTFDSELELLNIDLIKMGAMAEEAIDNSIKAFKNKDVSSSAAAAGSNRPAGNFYGAEDDYRYGANRRRSG